MMNFKNKYLFNKYALIIRQNRLVLFCEESSINLSYLKTIKKELKKQNFSLMTIKNNVFNKQFKNYNLKKLINGPIFIIYKKDIDYNTNFRVVQKFIDYKFFLCCLFEKKFYNPLVFKQFDKINSRNQLIFKSGIINLLFFIKFVKSNSSSVPGESS